MLECDFQEIQSQKPFFVNSSFLPCKKECLPHELVVAIGILCKLLQYTPANVFTIFNHATGPLRRRGAPAQVRASAGKFSSNISLNYFIFILS